MQQSVTKRFEAIAGRHKEVETLMSQPDVSKIPLDYENLEESTGHWIRLSLCGQKEKLKLQKFKH